MHCHCPSTASFQSVTVLLASETARMLPVVDQETRHTGTPKSLRRTASHEPPGFSVQTYAFPSCPALAIVFIGRPRLGAHATSRTQSACLASGEPSITHWPDAGSYVQILIRLSQPQDASRRTGSPGCWADTRAPGGTAGAHETAVTPTACAGSSVPILVVCQEPSCWCERIEMVLSDEPQASMSPSSGGAQQTLLTDEV
mmetsp:Transcript_37147/g.88311  ORF Transcript_37147/g.88311 Transcript_37147/m.88311 type:complete len:200 (-) Transcript_37147:423-1022(-)